MSEPKFSTVVVMAPGGDVWVSNNVPAGQEYYAIVTLANIEKPKGKPWIRIPAEPPEMPSEILYRGVLAADPYHQTITFELGDQIRGLEAFKQREEEEEEDDGEEFTPPDYDCTIK